MRIELFEAKREEEPILANLLQLYLHDFTDWADWDVEPDGRYATWDLDECWDNPARHPFFIVAEGHLAGFAIVDRGGAETDDADVWDMAEFFVMRKYRRKGVGGEIARRLFARFPGRWEVREMAGNVNAQAFWRRTIDAWTDGAYTESERARGGVMQRFVSG